MFDKLFEFLSSSWSYITPFIVVDAYDRGIVLRFGRYHKTLEPGFHWLWPFYEFALTQCVAWDTSSLHDQSLTTKDGVQVSVSAVLTWRVHDVSTFLIDVQDQNTVLADVAYGLVAQHVLTNTWSDLLAPEALERLKKGVRAKAFRFGIEVSNVQFANVTKSRSIRLLGMSS